MTAPMTNDEVMNQDTVLLPFQTRYCMGFELIFNKTIRRWLIVSDDHIWTDYPTIGECLCWIWENR